MYLSYVTSVPESLVIFSVDSICIFEERLWMMPFHAENKKKSKMEV